MIPHGLCLGKPLNLWSETQHLFFVFSYEASHTSHLLHIKHNFNMIVTCQCVESGGHKDLVETKAF